MPLLRRAWPLLLALALCARAAAPARVTGPVYAAPVPAWGGAVGSAFALPAGAALSPSLARSDFSSPEVLRSLSPVVHQLSGALNLTPEAFAALPEAERAASLELAVEAAREEVRLKAYELASRARDLARPSTPMDKEGRAELYETVAQLMELRRHYGEWLDAGATQAVEEGYQTASARAWEVRRFLLGEEKTDDASSAAKAPALQPFAVTPTPNAAKLREDMENNKSGWGQNDLHALYAGYGFTLREGGKHRFYSHPVFPDLTQSVSRQNDLPPGYAQSALKLIAELERRAEASRAAAAAPARNAGPPAALQLADLAVLLSPPAAVPAEPEAAPVPEKTRPEKPRRSEPKSPAPAPIPERIAAKTDPAPLQPAAPIAREEKREPPASTTEPVLDKGMLERLRDFTRRFRRGGSN